MSPAQTIERLTARVSELEALVARLRAVRQQSYAARHRAQGLCAKCANPARPGRVLCAEHAAKQKAANASREARGFPMRIVSCSRCGEQGHNARTCFHNERTARMP